MPEEKPKPIDQTELERRLKAGEPLDGVAIGDVDFSGKTFEYTPNFTGAIFTGKTKFLGTQFKDGVNFFIAQFAGDDGVDFYEAQFTGEGGADFRGAQFTGEGGVDFRRARFSGEGGAKFYDAKFLGEGVADFYGTQFTSKWGADFRGVQFTGKGGASFVGAKFTGRGGAMFYNAKFSGEGGVNFLVAEFTGEWGADFFGTQFTGEGKFRFVNTTFKVGCPIVFRNITVEHPENLMFEATWLGDASFSGTDVESIGFKNISFKEIGFWFWRRRCLADEFLEGHFKRGEEKTELGFYKDTNNYYRHVETLYRQFKRNFEEKRDYAGAGDFHYGEMEMRRKRQGWWGQILSLTLPYKLISGYGEKWGQALACFLGLWLAFSGLNLPLVELSKTHPDSIKQPVSCSQSWNVCSGIEWRDTFFFTLNALTLRKDPNVRVKNLWSARGAVAFQNLTGVAVIALMLLAIRRKFRR